MSLYRYMKVPLFIAALFALHEVKADDAADGQKLYDANCMACHQKEGAGKVGLAPNIGGADFLAMASDEFIENAIVGGRPGTAMVARPDLKGEKIAKITAYLRSIEVKNPRVIKVDNKLVHKGDAKNGHKLYGEFCAYCHGVEGEGYSSGGPGPGIGLSGFLNQASDDFILQTIKNGRRGTAMLGFVGSTGLGNLTEQEAKDIVVFLRQKSKPENVGVAKGASYQLCSACHGAGAEGNPAMKAPSLLGIGQDGILAQVKKFQAGQRGYHASDSSGQMMKGMVANLSETEIKNIAAEIEKLPAKAHVDTVNADGAKGKAAYMTCMACHGMAGEGNPALKAPAIAGLNDWYIVEQLKKFKSGQRGTAPGDVQGAMMRPMTLGLDEATMKNLATYIQSFKAAKKGK